MNENDWFDTFFDALANDVWRALVPDAVSDAEVDFLVRALALDPADRRVSRVLDVPSGDGRHARRLARRGHDVVAVDGSADALAHLCRAAAAEGVAVTTHHRDLRALGEVLAGAPPFDGACCMGNSFGYLDPDGTARFVAAVAGALRPGGRFVIDHPMVAEAALPHLQDRSRHEADGVVLSLENRYDVATSTVVGTMTLERSGERAVREVRHRVTTAREVVDGLAAAGFGVVDLLADVDGTPFTVGAGRLWVVAEKR